MACVAMSPDPPRLLSAIRGEYSEMPGMRLTRAQFGRLWQLDEYECNRVIKALIADRFLGEDRHGRLHSLRDASV